MENPEEKIMEGVIAKMKSQGATDEQLKDLVEVMSEVISQGGVFLLVCLVGSRAYNTFTENSDYDFKLIHILPTDTVLRTNPSTEHFQETSYKPQIMSKSHDVVSYELGRFLQLLRKANPTIMELISTDERHVIYKKPLFRDLIPDHRPYLTKKFKDSFIGYATAQIKKARGLNKSIMNPQPEIRKDVLEFCYFLSEGQVKPAWEFLRTQLRENPKSKFTKEQILELTRGWSITKSAKGMQTFFVYPSKGGKGLLSSLDSVNLKLSSVHKSEMFDSWVMTFNLNGFQVHCKEHLSYWKWVKNRNPHRYNTNMEHGKGFDSKNMLQMVRLIKTAKEIALTGDIHVWRDDREELMKIRNGEVEYDELIDWATEQKAYIDKLYENSDLPEELSVEVIEELLFKFRALF